MSRPTFNTLGQIKEEEAGREEHKTTEGGLDSKNRLRSEMHQSPISFSSAKKNSALANAKQPAAATSAAVSKADGGTKASRRLDSGSGNSYD